MWPKRKKILKQGSGTYLHNKYHKALLADNHALGMQALGLITGRRSYFPTVNFADKIVVTFPPIFIHDSCNKQCLLYNKLWYGLITSPYSGGCTFEPFCLLLL